MRAVGIDPPAMHHPSKRVQCDDPAASARVERLLLVSRRERRAGAPTPDILMRAVGSDPHRLDGDGHACESDGQSARGRSSRLGAESAASSVPTALRSSSWT